MTGRSSAFNRAFGQHLESGGSRRRRSTSARDLAPLRRAGFDDAQIFAITTFVALRAASSTINGALGARPDRELVDTVPIAVRDAVSYGRPPGP